MCTDGISNPNSNEFCIRSTLYNIHVDITCMNMYVSSKKCSKICINVDITWTYLIMYVYMHIMNTN